MPTYFPVRRMGITLDEEEFIARKLAQYRTEDGILDLGCGNCLITNRLSKTWGKKIVAVDLWDEFPMQLALQNAKEEGASIEVGKIERPTLRLPFPNGSFSFVYSVMFVYNLRKEERQNLFSEVSRVLSDKGLFLLVDPVIVRRERRELVGFQQVSYQEENALFYLLSKKG
jgi:SAM-dependent methyltransferase